MRAKFMQVGMEIETALLGASPPAFVGLRGDYLSNRASHIPGKIIELPKQFSGEVAIVYHPNGVPQKLGQGAALAAYFFYEIDSPQI